MSLACTERVPRLEVALRIMPVEDRVYVLEDRLGFENVHFGVSVAPPDAALSELRIEFVAGDNVVEEVRYGPAAIEARCIERDGTTVLRPFHLLLPKAVRADRLRLIAHHQKRTAATSVRLERYAQKGVYRLPVKGCWFVSSGHGFGVEHRRWYGRAHFAWDFVRVDETGRPHRGAGEKSEDYYAFGAPVIAPADGRVVFARGDRPDNLPGATGEDANYVLLDHGDGEHSKLAHFSKGSLRVKTGQRVKRGDVIASVGNSGRSDSPHLHVHFQRTIFRSGVVAEEHPLPVRFNDYLVTSNEGLGRRISAGRPRRGEFVCTP